MAPQSKRAHVCKETVLPSCPIELCPTKLKILNLDTMIPAKWICQHPTTESKLLLVVANTILERTHSETAIVEIRQQPSVLSWHCKNWCPTHNNCWGADEKGHEKEDRKLDCCLSFTFFVVFQNQTFGSSTRSSKSISVSSQAECKRKK